MAKPVKKKQPDKGHKPTGRIVGYVYCVRCGLMYLKNAATQKAIKEPCPYDDPE